VCVGLFEVESCYIAQAGLDFTLHQDPPASASPVLEL
jgi:hypothetical protein